MKVAIIVFSPSGNTLKVAKMLENSLMDRDIRVQMIDITRDKKLFGERNFKQFLKETVRSHDLLCIGGPVYVHHMHYNIQNLIKALPQPGNGWGKLAVPFTTYGRISSGVALHETTKLLKKSGRATVFAMKINSFHSQTKEFDRKINEGMPGDEALPVIGDLAERISKLEGVNPEKCLDMSGELNYQSTQHRIICKVFIRERLMVFPKVVFDYDKCEKCGKCIDICPVQRLEMTDTGPRKKSNGAKCIHCGECFYNCPFDAADHSMKRYEGMLMKAADGYGFLPSNEAPVSAVYPLR